MVWYSHPLKNFPQFIVIHKVKGFGIVNKAEIDVFLELSCFFHDSANVGNLISGSSAFSKSSWNIWKFTVHLLLKLGLENFEHDFTSGTSKGGITLQAAATTGALSTAERIYPASEVMGSGLEDQPQVQGAVAGQAQEGLEELSHVEGQEGQR